MHSRGCPEEAENCTAGSWRGPREISAVSGKEMAFMFGLAYLKQKTEPRDLILWGLPSEVSYTVKSVQQTWIPTDAWNITCHFPSDLPPPVSGWVTGITYVHKGPVCSVWLPSGVNMGLGCGFCLSLKLSVSFVYWVVSSPKFVGTQVSETAASFHWSWRVA